MEGFYIEISWYTQVNDSTIFPYIPLWIEDNKEEASHSARIWPP